MSVVPQNEEIPECPLCMESLDLDDLNFFPCACGYQICRFCWHRIRTDENGKCPACRKTYSENPADFKPLSQQEMLHIKQEKKQKDLIRKQKLTENRKHLANVRVVQKNLVFVVGLSSRLAEIEVLKRPDYFGKFGRIHKVVINHTTAYAGSQGPSASAYVTYQRAEDALKAIAAVNNIHVDGRTLKASLGTTKYCSHFMKNQPCPKPDCMYLHELGDESASFTKEEMQQGKHQDLEKRLQDQFALACSQDKQNGVCTSTVGLTNSLCEITPTPPQTLNVKKNNTKDLEPISDTIDEVITENSKESWPALGSITTKDGGTKRSRSKSERNSSARQTPTEENNKRNKEKKSLSKTNGIEDCSTPALGNHDSGNSSASTSPPPSQNTEIDHTESLVNRLQPSTPLPVNKSHSPLGFDVDTLSGSPVGTTPSSLSSCSEPSGLCPQTETGYTDVDSFLAAITDSPQEPQQQSPTTHRNGIQHDDHDFLRNSTSTNTTDADWLNKTNAEKVACDPDMWDHLLNRAVISEPELQLHGQLDEDLGFDIFEERTKALSEDIQREKKMEQEQLYQRNIQEQVIIKQHQLAPQQVQSQMSHSNLNNVIGGLSNGRKESQTRLPPPGFNGMSQNGYSLASTTQAHNKVMGPFQSQMNGDSAPSHQINSFVNPKVSINPGMTNSMLTHGIQANMPNSINNMSHQTGNQMLSYDAIFGNNMHIPNGQSSAKSSDPFVLKEMENRIDIMRNLSAMNTANALTSLVGNAQTHQQIQQNSQLNNFYNGQPQQPHVLPYSSHSMMHMNNSSQSIQKGWVGSNGSDLSVMDPAIVSSGQLTDSRTDSPPRWLSGVDAMSSTDGSSWNLPYGLLGNVGSFAGAHAQRNSMWPPTSPPPGFNTIAPIHAKQRDSKLENL